MRSIWAQPLLQAFLRRRWARQITLTLDKAPVDMILRVASRKALESTGNVDPLTLLWSISRSNTVSGEWLRAIPKRWPDRLSEGFADLTTEVGSFDHYARAVIKTAWIWVAKQPERFTSEVLLLALLEKDVPQIDQFLEESGSIKVVLQQQLRSHIGIPLDIDLPVVGGLPDTVAIWRVPGSSSVAPEWPLSYVGSTVHQIAARIGSRRVENRWLKRIAKLHCLSAQQYWSVRFRFDHQLEYVLTYRYPVGSHWQRFTVVRGLG